MSKFTLKLFEVKVHTDTTKVHTDTTKNKRYF